MRRLALLIGGLALVMATTLAPKPVEAINCNSICAVATCPYGCGVVCVPEGWPCTCGCFQ